MKLSSTRAGILAFLFGTVILFVGLVVFSNYPGVFAKGKNYQAEFGSVAGLNVGAEVRYGGVLVGTVTETDFSAERPTRILVKFKVENRTPVREDTRAAITQVGLLGEQYLNLEPGRADSPPLPENSTLESTDNLNFQDAMNRVARFLEQADSVFGGIDRLAKSSPIERFDRILTRMDQLMESAGSGTDRVFTRLDDVGGQVAALVTRTERVLAGADSSIRGIGPGFTETQREALATLRETRAMVADLRDALQQHGGVDELVRNLSITAENLATLSERIERDPTSVLRRREPPKKIVGPPIRD